MLNAENSYVVLVEPENPRNIGFVARSMKCNDISDLRIVNPEVDTMSDEAFITGVSGRPILEAATFYKTVDEALADATEAVAFSRRTFNDAPVKIELPELPATLNLNGKTALVFGRESQGLSKEEIAACSRQCYIPIRSTMSYNLGQAAAIALYELAGKKYSYDEAAAPTEKLPTHEEKEVLLSIFKERVPEKIFAKGNRETQLSNIINKIGMTKDELHMFIGLLKSFQ